MELLTGIIVGLVIAWIAFIGSFATLYHLGGTWSKQSVMKALLSRKKKEDTEAEEEDGLEAATGPIISDDERDWKRSGAY